MMRTSSALRMSTGIMLGLLTACGQQPIAAPPAKTAKSDIDEVEALVAATKQHPSLVNAKDAGPPIHVDPFPKTGGMVHHQHMTK